MAFQAVLARQLAAFAEQLTAAAAEDIEALVAQVSDLTSSRDRYRARAEELTAVNDSLSLELEARAAEREVAASAITQLETERERSTRLAGQLASLESQHAELQRQTRILEECATAQDGRVRSAPLPTPPSPTPRADATASGPRAKRSSQNSRACAPKRQEHGPSSMHRSRC
jgi:chromosome segregation ATPase